MKKSLFVRLLRPLAHFLMLLVVFFFVYKLRLITDLIPWIQLPIPQIHEQSMLIFALLASFGFVMLGIFNKLYIIDKKSQKSFMLLSKVWWYWLIINTFVIYFWTGLFWEFGPSRFILLVSAVLVLVIFVLFDSLWFFLEKKYYQKNKRKALVISTNIENHQSIIDELIQNSHYDITVVNSNDDHANNTIQRKEYASIFIVGDVGKERLQNIFDKIRFSDTRFYHFSEGQFVQDVVYKTEYVANMIAIEYTHSTLDGWSLIFKRIFDIVMSVLWIIALSWLFLLVAIIIKLDSKWPVFFFQKRVGKWWKEFLFIKFRSMVPNAESLKKDLLAKNERKGPLFKIKNDPRITKFWKFLRKSSIDELPQLFCVLMGTMSLVWPRPHLPTEVEKYEAREKRLLSVNPWITGYAQVFGRDSLSFAQEAKLDLYYIQKWSVLMDIYVILNTFLVVFKGK